jgi:hypothetical protein
MREGLGSVSYGAPSSAGGGGGGTVTGADNGLTDVANVVQLGQTVGAAGNPARLLHSSDIPISPFQLSFITDPGIPGAALRISPNPIPMLEFDPGTTSQQTIMLLTVQGKAPPPGAPFGNFQIGWLDQGFVNPDGQIDAVMSTGYNTDGGNGRFNPNEASFATVLESHFQIGGSPKFEWYLTTDSYTGIVNRHFFLVVDKTNGTGQMVTHLDSWTYNTTTAFPGLPNFTYATLSPGGMTLVGPAVVFTIATPTPAADGAVSIFPQAASNGKTVFADESGSPLGFFQFNAACVWETAILADGFSNYWFLSTSPVGGTNGLIFQNSNFDPGAPIFQIFNNGNISNYNNAFFGNGGTYIPNPSARVHIQAGTGAPGTASLKLVAGPLLAVPEDGAIEYDGTNFYKTIGAVRSIIL